MAIRTEGWPAAEGMVRVPESEAWAFANQVILIPFEIQIRAHLTPPARRQR